jgi:hypothetical protein
MAAAAELEADPRHRHRAHAIAVLLAEQRHRAGSESFLVRALLDLGPDGAQHPAVHEILDPPLLLGRHRLSVGEVEAQAIGGDERTRLARTFAHHLVQRSMQQVRRRVVALNRRPALGIDGKSDLLILPQLSGIHDHIVKEDARALLLGIEHPRRPAAPRKTASITNLAAGLRIERRPIEHDEPALTRTQALGRRQHAPIAPRSPERPSLPELFLPSFRNPELRRSGEPSPAGASKT